jgi:hypothetical protein
MAETMTGGCACGRIRYTAKVEGDDAYLCHCRMCQRSSGSLSLALRNVKAADVEWGHEPAWYDSSPIAVRPYCRECGTSLGFKFKDGSENMDLTVASFDDPSRFVPTAHAGAESLHEAWLDTRALPRQRSDEIESVVSRWHAAGREVPE